MLTSTHNPRIKNLLALEKPRVRRETGLFIIEGIKELSLAIEAQYELTNVFYCPAIISQNAFESLDLPESILVPVSEAVFEKIAYRKTTGGVVAIAKQRNHRLANIFLSDNPLVLVLESVEKPGNLGALLRTADAAKLDAVIICDPQTDFYNANVVRSSVGCLFTTQLAAATSEETIEWLRNNKIEIYCTYLEGSVRYDRVDFKQPSAIVMGTESTGLSDLWINSSDQNIKIPMRGKIDSMNVSVAAAVTVFEALRQRGF
ncbi:MAG: RNA methyltransferase [Cytophagales bacterium]